MKEKIVTTGMVIAFLLYGCVRAPSSEPTLIEVNPTQLITMINISPLDWLKQYNVTTGDIYGNGQCKDLANLITDVVGYGEGNDGLDYVKSQENMSSVPLLINEKDNLEQCDVLILFGKLASSDNYNVYGDWTDSKGDAIGHTVVVYDFNSTTAKMSYFQQNYPTGTGITFVENVDVDDFVNNAYWLDQTCNNPIPSINELELAGQTSIQPVVDSAVVTNDMNTGDKLLIIDMYSNPENSNMAPFNKILADSQVTAIFNENITTLIDEDLMQYSVIIFGSCSLMSLEEVETAKSMLTDYVVRGGSLLYLSNNDCLFTPDDNKSKSEYANVISEQWGMIFHNEDYSYGVGNEQKYHNIFWMPLGLEWTSYSAPMALGGMKLFSPRYTVINVKEPARSHFCSDKGSFMALYDDPSAGFVVGIADEKFLLDELTPYNGPDNLYETNFILLQDLINWMINRPLSKTE